MRGLLLVLALFILFAPTPIRADFDMCGDDLDELSTKASSAADAARAVSEAKDELDDAKQEYRNCVQFPDIYDLMEDGCQSRRFDYQMALDTYNSAIDEFNTEMRGVVASFKGLRASCVD
jgi:hypothetical protein